MLVEKFWLFEISSPVRRVVGMTAGRAPAGPVDEKLERVREIDRKMGTVSQVFDARGIAGKEHLAHASRLAILAHSGGFNFAESLSIELLCWAAAERQIRKAFDKVGIRRDSEEVAVVSIGHGAAEVSAAIRAILHELVIGVDEEVLDLTPSKTLHIAKVFGLPRAMVEMFGVKKLVLERVALLALKR